MQECTLETNGFPDKKAGESNEKTNKQKKARIVKTETEEIIRILKKIDNCCGEAIVYD
ncbi:MAG: hypothetical protein AABY07_08075 [Nanoarchaeota archaeon]